MNGKFFWVLVTAIFVVVGHLAYVLFIPGYKMANKFETGLVAQDTPSFIRLSKEQTMGLFPAEDPAVLHAVCPFDVSQGTVKISVAPFEHYWSLSVYSQKGDNYFSINDRQSIDSKLSIQIRQAIQKDETIQNKPRELVPDLTVIDAPTPKGWAVLRFRVRNGTSRATIAERAKSFLCRRDNS